MVSEPRSFWQKVRKPLEIAGIILACLLVVGFIVSFIGEYFYGWTWTGFGPFTPPTSDYQRGATLYDWLQLLIIPAVLALGGYLFNYTTGRTEREVASGRQREEALQAYFNYMSELLLDRQLRKSGEDDEVRTIARVRTVTVLLRLDGARKRAALQFLYESGLIDKGKRIVDMFDADLSDALLSALNLSGADLSGAFLENASLDAANLNSTNLSESFLNNASLTGADLTGAYLERADLAGADLTGAILTGADLTGVDLSRADLTAAILSGAIMPDGSKHP